MKVGISTNVEEHLKIEHVCLKVCESVNSFVFINLESLYLSFAQVIALTCIQHLY